MSIFLKLFIAVFTSIAIAFIIYATKVIELKEEYVYGNLNSKIEYNEKVYTASMSPLLYTLNSEVLKSTIDAIYIDKEIIKIDLIDHANIINITLDDKFDNKAKHLISVIKLNYDGENIGKLVLTYTISFAQNEVKQYKYTILAFSIVLILILVLVLSIFIRRLSASIKLLTDASTQIASGDLSKELNIKTKDEIGVLANTFEAMRIALKSRSEANEKQAKQIQQLNNNLQLKVLERTRDLEKSNKELQESIVNLEVTQKQLIEAEKMASLGSLVAGISHEINTPVGVSLTASTHFNEIIKKLKNEYENDEITEESFERFIKNSNEVSNLIQTNLTRTAKLVKSFKQISVDQISEQKRVFNIKSYIYEVLFSISNITKKTKVEIYVNGDEIEVNTYAGAISQVVTNLVINSINHGYDKDEEGNISISLRKKNNNLRIFYKDDGKGISKENLPKIFDPFFTTNREHGGTGLGLNIVYNIVTSKLKGSIVCHSSPNDGAEFIINIPVSVKD